MRLLGLLSSELATHSPAGEEHKYLQCGAARMLERLGGKDLPGPEHPAATIADYWWLRLNNAHERTHEQGAPVPMTSEQRALAEIRSDLLIGETTLEPPTEEVERNDAPRGSDHAQRSDTAD